MKKRYAIGLAAMLAAPAAFAADMPMASGTAYVTQSKLAPSGGTSEDGTGFGLRGWAAISGPFFGHAEYQSASEKPSSGPSETVRQFRVGGGAAGELQKGTMWLGKLEYVNIKPGSTNKFDGVGVHAGLMQMVEQLHFFGTVGYLTTSGDNSSKLKGMEFDVGAGFNFTKELGAVLDYRLWKAKFSDPTSSNDVDVSDIRLGVSYSFY